MNKKTPTADRISIAAGGEYCVTALSVPMASWLSVVELAFPK